MSEARIADAQGIRGGADTEDSVAAQYLVDRRRLRAQGLHLEPSSCSSVLHAFISFV